MTVQDILIEYSKNPPNKGILEHATLRYKELNRLCADVCEVFLVIENDRVQEFSFDGYMSITATACTALFGESILGKMIEEVLSLDESYMLELLGGPVSQRRRNATVFGLLATKNALEVYRGHEKRYDFSDVLIM
jgi:nitrogen fixation NifU-like protein